jgi:hypothetical protein
LTIPTAADYLREARRKHQDAVHFACDFWEASDLLSCLSAFANWVSRADIGTDGTALEIGISLRRSVTEKCVARWGAGGKEDFRKINDALYDLHVTLHAASGVVTEGVRVAGLLLKHEIQEARWRDSM